TGSRRAISTWGRLALPLDETLIEMELMNSKVAPDGEVAVSVTELSVTERAGPVPRAAVADWMSTFIGIANSEAGSSAPSGLPGTVWEGMSWSTSKDTRPQPPAPAEQASRAATRPARRAA